MGFTNGKFAMWGHSFGAYATSNLITRTDIFAAAVSGATPPELFRNWASGRDRDSRNIETGQARMGGSPFEFPERYLSQSAFFHLDKVNTPVLILHGEKDLTILFGEGEMMFYALRQLGKTAEFVPTRMATTACRAIRAPTPSTSTAGFSSGSTAISSRPPDRAPSRSGDLTGGLKTRSFSLTRTLLFC